MAEQVARAVAGGANESTPLTKQNSFGSSHYDLEYNPMLNDKQIIADFRFRVYALLSAQLVATLAMGIWFTCTTTGYNVGKVLNTGPAGILLAILSFVLIIAMFCYKDRYPANLILFSGLTLILGSSVGFTSAFVSKALPEIGNYGISKGAEIVLLAAGLTAVIFLSLTVYVIYSKQDFSFLGGFLFVCLIANIVLGFFGWLFSIGVMAWITSIFGIFIFTGYILYDTDQIVNKVELHDVDLGTALVGALELYLDVINLFLHILQLLLLLMGDR